MASPTTSPTAAYAGERAHVLARFDVLTRRFANATNDATTVSTLETNATQHGNAVPESGLMRTNDDDLDDDDESAVLPFSETRASLTVCDFAGTGGNRVPTRSGDRIARDALTLTSLTPRARTPATRRSVTRTSRSSWFTLGGGDRLRCCFGARDAPPTRRGEEVSFQSRRGAAAIQIAEAFASASQKFPRTEKKPAIRVTRWPGAKRAGLLGRVALGREDARLRRFAVDGHRAEPGRLGPRWWR